MPAESRLLAAIQLIYLLPWASWLLSLFRPVAEEVVVLLLPVLVYLPFYQRRLARKLLGR